MLGINHVIQKLVPYQASKEKYKEEQDKLGVNCICATPTKAHV